MSNHGWMDEGEALDLVVEFAGNQTRLSYQANNTARGMTQSELDLETKLSQEILRRLIGRDLDDCLKTELAKRLSD